MFADKNTLIRVSCHRKVRGTAYFHKQFDVLIKAGFQPDATHATQGTCVKFYATHASHAMQRITPLTQRTHCKQKMLA